ncbi:hypothetical protein SCHPADRAFT_817421 [Schizopora paradoxa]|uniref:Protein YOP1 n=1 Tax=Schizopora paradoxa TaxID=27342 RepID=A0A0H2S6Q0_9AGAM|nr:hypothetical protein SCHPADRAFT_817421 [Schizopora paradoxa]
MPVIVPILRVALLFLNVYDTFKTLKLPQRSARTGKRTVQATSQRKRNMKGCMCVWLVWCASIFLERILDNAIGIFMPFYNELKAVVFLFQLLTRTKATEPIYIHVLRPLIKPYVATLDYALDLLHGLGDFMLLVLSLPYHLLMDWWHPKQSHQVDSDSSDSNQDDPLDAGIPSVPVGSSGGQNTVGVRTRRSRPTSRPQSNAIAGPSSTRSTSRTNNIVPSKSDPTVQAVSV